MTPEDRRVEEALRAVADDYVRRNPADLHRARARLRQLRRRRQLRAGAVGALGAATALVVAVYAWPSGGELRSGPRPAGNATPPGPVEVTVGGAPSEVAVGHGAIWVADTAGEKVVRLDPESNEVQVSVPVGGSPGDLAVDGSGAVWVAIPELGEVQRIDPSTNALTPDMRVDAGEPGDALDLAIESYLWVSVVGRELVQVNPTSGAVVARFDTLHPVNVAARPGGVFVLEPDGTVRGLDPATGAPTLEIGFDVEGRGDIHFYGGRLWVAQGDGNELYSVDAAGAEEIRSYRFRGTYLEMAMVPQGVLVLSDLGDGTGVLSLIGRDGVAEEVAELDGTPRDLVRGLGDLWVSNYTGGTVTRFDDVP